MAAANMLFIDLPGEMRNLIYEHYLATIDETTISISAGVFLPPHLARASRQIRKEFMPYWLGHAHNLDKVDRVKARVFDLDFQALIAFCNRVAEVTKRTKLFECIEFTLIFTKSWTSDDSKAKLRECADWILREDGFILSDLEDFLCAARFDCDHLGVADAFLPDVSNQDDEDEEPCECLSWAREAVDAARGSRRLELGLESESEDSDLERGSVELVLDE